MLRLFRGMHSSHENLEENVQFSACMGMDILIKFCLINEMSNNESSVFCKGPVQNDMLYMLLHVSEHVLYE